jgi:formate dehydrogenase
VQTLPRDRASLLSNLGALRRERGPITPELSDELADAMGIRRGEVAEVVSFYSYLGLPTDAVRVCTGPLCACLGAEVPPGAVEAPCLGLCDLAPASMRGDAVEQEVVHNVNDGPSTALARGDEPAPPLDVPAPERVLAELEASGLRGLGGAGFPTATKWAAVLREPGPRVLLVNADEGEPGTFKDRYLLELRPRLVLEGVRIAMETIEAVEGWIYIREEYATARRVLERALADTGPAGVRIVVGAGSYVCGEETAMLESMEGRRGMPRLRPPYPAQRGHLARPTLVNNVETLAHLPAILRHGGAWFAAQGTPRLWSVSGAVARPGCYEVGAGVTARQLVEEYAGGATAEIGAFVPGGAASGLLPPDALDVPLTNEALREWGAGVGSAALQIFPASVPPRQILERTLAFFAEESCQKCTPCRIGTRTLRDVAAGQRTLPRPQLEEWLEAIELGSICGLGQSAPVPVRNALRYWPDVLS